MRKRAAEIAKIGENQHLLPFPMYMGANYLWFDHQFSRQTIAGFLWAFAFVLAGVAAARSLGGSLMGNMQGMVYTGKKGRKLVFYKLLAVLAVTGSAYLGFYLLGLFLNAGACLQEGFCKFYILPHFEGLSLLLWGGVAAILAILGFVRFRRTAL